MAEPRTEVIEMMERGLEDARSGRLQAAAFIGLGDDEHVLCFSFDDDHPEMEVRLLNGCNALAFEIIMAPKIEDPARG